MKYKINFKRALMLSTLGLSLAFTSCTDDFEEINTNEKAVSALSITDTKYQLANVQYNFAFQYMEIDRTENPSNLLIQHLVQTQYTDVSQYNFATNAGDNFYDTWIRKSNDLQAIINTAEVNKESISEGQYSYVKGISLAMKVFALQNVTDHFGPIPYAEAFKGSEGKINFTPAYESQEAVYTNLVKDINEAITLLKNASDENVNMYGNVDKVYGGKANSWLKFANSLKLRIAARLFDVDQAKSLTMISEAKADAISSNDDNASYPFGSDNYQPIADSHIGRTDYVVSETLVDILSNLSDPRLSVFADKTQKTDEDGKPVFLNLKEEETIEAEYDHEKALDDKGAQKKDKEGALLFLDKDGEETTKEKGSNIAVMIYKGGINGAANGATLFSGIDDVLRNNTSYPTTFIQHAEVEFILAEAAVRSGNMSEAKTHYEAAIQSSLDKWGVDAVEAGTYISSLTWEDEKAIENIATQKWISLYTQGSEAWAEWRRLDYPMLQKASGATIDTPLRLFYPSNESSANSVNYNAGVVLLGGADDTKTKLWWDKK